MNKSNQEQLDHLRHSAAHLLAAAVLELYPDTKNTIGPSIENGFYYDFEFSKPISEDALPQIEKKMHELVKSWKDFERTEVSKSEALKHFSHNSYKQELINEFAEEGKTLTLYKSGEFTDLCRGGHIDNPAKSLKYFKLMSLAGAYWRGDEKNTMLTRIYGTAWNSQKELDDYLHMLEEAKKRDHRRLGIDLDLFSTDERLGQGLILWHPKGAIIRKEIEDFERELILRHGYDLVYTPHIASEKLFEVSGHLENYADSMYGPLEIDEFRYRLKPMNCPGHICIYQNRVRSYRELPMRLAEFGTVYRYELSGTLQGMLRVRGFTQDDAHVFCTPEQIVDELTRMMDLVDEMLAAFGYPYTIELSTRPEKAIGDESVWDKAIETLKIALKQKGKDYIIDEGGGAFYGPKLDYKLIDSLGRKWQGPTVQLDFNLPERFNMAYVGQDGKEHRPVMLHRVLVGSMERFFGGLVEHYGGAFPVWLAPIQAVVIPISDKHLDYANEIGSKLREQGVRLEIDARNESMGAKIRDAQMQKVPFMLIVGDKEVAEKTVAVRSRDGQKQEVLHTEEFLDRITQIIADRA